MDQEGVLSVPLRSFEDHLWAVQIQVGTPPRNYTVAVDTGSADLWLDASFFNESMSSSFAKTGQTFSIDYDLGEVTGYTCTDQVQLQGLQVPGHKFGVATNISGTNIPKGIEGVLGMAGQDISQMQATPLWHSLELSENLFSMYMKGKSQGNLGNSSSDGTLILGAMDPHMFVGPLNQLATTSDDTWTIPFSGINVSNHIIHVPKNTDALIDSGTVLVGGPRSAIEKFYEYFEDAKEIHDQPGFYSFPCSLTPTVYLAFGDSQYKLDSADLLMNDAHYAPDNPHEQPDADDFRCVGTFFAMDANQESWVIGDAFLKNVYTVFDDGPKRQIGFAPLQVESQSQMLPTGLPSKALRLAPIDTVLFYLVTGLVTALPVFVYAE